jgi:hypothetical protein
VVGQLFLATKAILLSRAATLLAFLSAAAGTWIVAPGFGRSQVRLRFLSKGEVIQNLA